MRRHYDAPIGESARRHLGFGKRCGGKPLQATARGGKVRLAYPGWIECARRRELEEGFDQGEEARGRLPEWHVPRGGNYDYLGVGQDIRCQRRIRQRERG